MLIRDLFFLRKLRKVFRGWLLGAVILLCLMVWSVPASVWSAGSDDWAGAVVVDPSTLPYSDTSDTTTATTEAGEPFSPCGSGSASNSIWYSLTSTSFQSVVIDTSGSSYDTILSVWTGGSLPTLSNVACNDDYVGLTSQVTIALTAGTTYYIRVSSYSAGGGTISNLNIAAITSLGDRVWYDQNSDGIQDPGEPGVPTVYVELYTSGGSFVSYTYTDALGNFHFNISPGDYYLRFYSPFGYTFTLADQGGDDTLDSDADAISGQTPIISLLPNESQSNWDAGLTASVVGDFIWYDQNSNGIQDVGEPGINGAYIELYDSFGSYLSYTYSDINGFYSFVVSSGDYFIRIYPPYPYSPTTLDQGGDDTLDSDIDPSTGQTAVFNVPASGGNITIDAGLTTTSIGGNVWEDLNLNGIQDAGEPPVVSMYLEVYTSDGSYYSYTYTDSFGEYFVYVSPGDYYVRFYPDYGYSFALQDQGGDDSLDSDADPTTGQTAVTTLSAGENETTIDAGIVLTSLGGFVWDDLNADGIQDPGEPPISNVYVELYDSFGYYVNSAYTGFNGEYTIPALIGDYYLQFYLPTGYGFTLQDQGGDDDLDSDPDPFTGQTVLTIVSIGEQDTSWDAGMVTATIGDFVWEDQNLNNIQDPGEPGVSDVYIVLYDSFGNYINDTYSSFNGQYSLSAPPGDYYLQFYLPNGYAFVTPDQGGDDNLDSDVDPFIGQTPLTTLLPGENDLSWDAGMITARIGDRVWRDLNQDGIQDPGEPGIPYVAIELYDSFGNYVNFAESDFNGNYQFNALPGDYFLQFYLPYGYQFTLQDQGGDDTLDSDVDPFTGQTPVFTLDPGETEDNWDAGGVVSTIGDWVWYDENSNHIQDPDESGIESSYIELYDSFGSYIASAYTDSDGYYFFEVPPGDYYLNFYPPYGYNFAQQDIGGDDSLDSDVDPNTNQTPVFTIGTGQVDLNWDAGMQQTLIGDRLWHDYNSDGIQDPGEPGIPYAYVELYDGFGNYYDYTYTDGNGEFFFYLSPGDYYLTYYLPFGFSFTLPDQGSDDTLDSDADPFTGQTPVTTIDLGEADVSWDAGATTTGIGDFVWIDLNGDGIQDANEPGAPDVYINLYDEFGSYISSAYTGPSGYYSFAGLADGNYYLDFSGVDGISPANVGGDDSVDSDVDPITGLTPVFTLPPNSFDSSWDMGFYKFINNGIIELGVHPEGHLNVYGGTPSSGTGTTAVGLRYLPTNAESTAPGCLCEGWGAGDAFTGITGYANVDVDGGANNMTVISFTKTITQAISVVEIGGGGDDPPPNSSIDGKGGGGGNDPVIMRVTHDYHPSPDTPFLYEVTVTIENVSEETIDPRYRRVMDWDVEPTAFFEYVTLVKGDSISLTATTNNGFDTANPLAGQTPLFECGALTGSFEDAGPCDHGALFDFDFVDLVPGDSLQFNTFYGASGNEVDALGAISAVQAEAYSIGQPAEDGEPVNIWRQWAEPNPMNLVNGDWEGLDAGGDAPVPLDQVTGEPNTFIFAFGNVGGTAILPACTLSPDSFNGDIGQMHTVTAFVTNSGTPVPLISVTFEVISGPNAGTTGSGITDVNGVTSFSYIANGGIGMDVISASGFVSDEPFSCFSDASWQDPTAISLQGVALQTAGVEIWIAASLLLGITTLYVWRRRKTA